ncbi:N-acetyltransferase [bacterium AH-315-P15]|nr:N-acetyltransferase [bacterium AH-315-P15]
MTAFKLEICFEDTGKKGRYFAEVARERVLLIFSHEADGVISTDHTFVPRALEGQGIARALVAHAVEDARTKGWKIRPICSYVVARFNEHPEWADVLAPEAP